MIATAPAVQSWNRSLVAARGRFSHYWHFCIFCYNILNKRTVGQRTPDRRHKLKQKIAPYLTRTRALFFVCKISNEGYYSTKHNYKLKQIRICNHQHQPPFTFVSGGWHNRPFGSPGKYIIFNESWKLISAYNENRILTPLLFSLLFLPYNSLRQD